MNRLTKVKNAIDKVLLIVCVALFMILVVVVSWQVVARQILNDPSQWSETLSRYLFVWVGMLGAALVFGERGHIAIDVAARRLPEVPQKVLAIVVQLIVIVFSAYILVWGGWRATDNAWGQNLSGLPTTVGMWYLVLPMAGVLIIFYSIYHMLGVGSGEEAAFDDDVPEPV